MVPVMLDSYDALETTLAYMKNIKLVSFPGENIANFWATILGDAGILHSALAFNTEHLSDISVIFEESKYLHFWIL